jgi:Kef-type K+ transport system membrane component KefB
MEFNSYSSDGSDIHRELSNFSHPFSNTISLFFIQMVVIITTTRVLSFTGHYFKQPRVCFEIIAGILLGGTALGRSSNFRKTFFPDDSLVYLELVSEIGVFVYMFQIALEMDRSVLITHAPKVASTAIFGKQYLILIWCIY